MEYHVHVYQIAVKGEVDIEASSSREAREKAIEMAREGKVSLCFPDCGILAQSFPGGYGRGNQP